MTLKQKVKKGFHICFASDIPIACMKCPYAVKDESTDMQNVTDCQDLLIQDTIKLIADLEEKNKKLSKQVKDLKGTVIVLEDLLKTKE